ncbi:winged helix-turn-helix transcriptional regulator [Methanoculleus palmolei]|uniref:Winged helix-turn-helix transcriptional regulator n=1 Tax=Methanoculleus palmolei TaxID=72612 RepID=A0ABD8A8U8_9EURY|nr:winged helix-turn-helix transcriptional regulator [Methanoculleus palmolei]
MVQWSRLFTVLLVAVTLAALVLPGTAAARYVVEPVTEEYAGEWHNFEEITFWDLPPRVMALYFLLTVLPGLPYAGELFYALSFLAPLGFRRITNRTVLDDDFRNDLYRQIASHPGADFRELRRLTGASRGRLRYHLNTLVREGKVAAVDYRNRAGHFVRNRAYTDLEQRILISLRDETSRAVLANLLKFPGALRSEIVERLGLSSPSISRQMQQFKAEGIVAAERDGRFIRYRLSEGARDLLNRHVEDLPLPQQPATKGYPVAPDREVSSG